MTIQTGLRAALFCAALAGGAAHATNVYTFGDSLVDAGNISIATGGTIPSTAQGYFQGRFTNGLNYVDFLAQRFEGANTTPSLAGGQNYAFGGARAIGPAFGGVQVPGLPQQLGSYFASTGGAADSNGLYIINFGGNDLFGIGSGDIGGLTPTQAVNLLIGNTVTAVQTLSAAGAGKILVTGIPVGGAQGFAVEGLLQSALSAVEPGLTAQLYRFSYLDFYARFGADPASYGFPTVDYATPCIAARPVINGNINCAGFFSFDGTHFTAQVQRGIARDMVQLLGVPEPATWGMMIAGFGLVGFAARRRSAGEATSA